MTLLRDFSRFNVSNCNVFVANNHVYLHPFVRVPAPDRSPWVTAMRGGAWWQRDEWGLEGDTPARPPTRVSPLPPPPTHTWVAIHESRSYVR